MVIPGAASSRSCSPSLVPCSSRPSSPFGPRFPLPAHSPPPLLPFPFRLRVPPFPFCLRLRPTSASPFSLIPIACAVISFRSGLVCTPLLPSQAFPPGRFSPGLCSVSARPATVFPLPILVVACVGARCFFYFAFAASALRAPYRPSRLPSLLFSLPWASVFPPALLLAHPIPCSPPLTCFGSSAFSCATRVLPSLVTPPPTSSCTPLSRPYR